MPDPECGVTTLRRRARRVLRLHGLASEECFQDWDGTDYIVTEWVGPNIRVVLDGRGDELEVEIVGAGLSGSQIVLLESYGQIVKVDESLVDLANEILGKVIVLDELADS